MLRPFFFKSYFILSLFLGCLLAHPIWQLINLIVFSAPSQPPYVICKLERMDKQYGIKISCNLIVTSQPNHNYYLLDIST